MSKAKYYSRSFLNKKEGTAFIESSIELTDYCVYADVAIADCNKKVTLDFGVFAVKDYDEKLSKLEKLISELSEVYMVLAVNKESWLVSKAESMKTKRRKSISRTNTLEQLLNS